MKTIVLALAGSMSLAACATAPGPMVENGYAPGALGLAAIERADWRTAEARLTDANSDTRDPAKLINLGTVYMETGRNGEALSAWRLALASDRHHLIETRGGRVLSTRDLAREALALHDTGLRSADSGR